MMTLLLAALALASQHQHVPGMQHPSGYQGLEARELKVYSEEEVRALENGEGMGYALVAELTHYPGPKHVLELSVELGLSPEQVTSAQRLYDEMHASTVRLGRELVDKERQFQELFVNAEAESARELAVAIGALDGELRWAHLEAHIHMRRLLTADQIRRYDELRGYE